MNWNQIDEMISTAEDEDITRMLEEITKRQKRLYPDWEGMYLSFPLRRPDICKQILETTWEMLSVNMKGLS